MSKDVGDTAPKSSIERVITKLASGEEVWADKIWYRTAWYGDGASQTNYQIHIEILGEPSVRIEGDATPQEMLGFHLVYRDGYEWRRVDNVMDRSSYDHLQKIARARLESRFSKPWELSVSKRSLIKQFFR